MQTRGVLRWSVGSFLSVGVVITAHADLRAHTSVPTNQEALQVYHQMKQLDEILLREFAVEYVSYAETRHDGDWSRPFGEDYHDQTSSVRVRITYNPNSIAVMRDLVSLCHINGEKVAFYQKPDEQGARYWRSLPTKTYSLRSPQMNADYLKYAFLFFDETGCIAQRKPDYSELILYSVNENGFGEHPTCVMMLCSGRGYTRGIERVMNLSKRADGMLELRAWGYFPDAHLFPTTIPKDERERAEWRLVIEPGTLLVREAYWGGRLVCLTEGVIGVEYPIAQRGRYYFLERLYRETVVFRSAQPRFSQVWFAEASRHITDPEEGTLIRDKRFFDPPLVMTYKKGTNE